MPTRVTEAEMAIVVRKILRNRPNQTATFADLRDIVPKHLHLSRADRVKSPSRPGEEMWMQIIRNLSSHKREGFSGVQGGIRLDWRGSSGKRSARSSEHADHRAA